MNDQILAQQYVAKFTSSKDRGIEFSLTFAQFKRLKSTKRCYYTGLLLDKDSHTIDRVDNTLGYVQGNCVACHTSFNTLKSVWENPINDLTEKLVIKAINKLKRK